MANRFTQTDKWKDLWFRNLPIEAKVLFEYIRDNCDIAGFWKIDFELAAFDTGLPLTSEMTGVFENIKSPFNTIEGALKGLERCYLREGDVIWVKNFLLHQKNLPLNPENKCHQGILRIIHSYDSFGKQVLSEIEQQIKDKGLGSPSGNGIGNSNILSRVRASKEPKIRPKCFIDKKTVFGRPQTIRMTTGKIISLGICPDCQELFNQAVKEQKFKPGKTTVQEVESCILNLRAENKKRKGSYDPA